MVDNGLANLPRNDSEEFPQKKGKKWFIKLTKQVVFNVLLARRKASQQFAAYSTY